MRIVIAPDSFKGSLAAIQAAETMEQAIREVYPVTVVDKKPMADGGEGTLDSLLAAEGGRRILINCLGPLGKKIDTAYGIVHKTTAIIECATIAGLTQVPEQKRNPDTTTSYGIGEVIKDALDRGCTSFIIGLGGSATNDGGIGMLQALGLKAYDKNGVEIGPFGRDLLRVDKIDFAKLDTRLSSIDIKVACDVDNPLCGKLGASVVYGPQKGASEDQVKKYDEALNNYSELVAAELHQSYQDIPGAGAAGGLGFALLTIGADLVSGAKLIANAMNLDESIKHADLVLTGEGQSDAQTLYGKAPGYVADLAAKHGVPAVLLSGSLGDDADVLRKKFAGCFSIIRKPASLDECMANADKFLFDLTKQVVNFFKVIK